MSAQIGFGAIVLDCPDPRALAGFYGGLLERPIAADAEDDWVDLEGTPTVSFQRADNYAAPEWPDGEPQQFHPDLTVDDMIATHARAIELGAVALEPREAPASGDTRTFRVYADPAGHPFCLCAC